MADVLHLSIEGAATAIDGVQERAVPGCIPTPSWLQVRYRTTLYGSAVRPVIRFVRDGEDMRFPMSAALFGLGEWIGPVPEGTREVQLVLPDGYRPTDLRLTTARMLSLRELFSLASRRNLPVALLAAGLRASLCRTASDGLLRNLFGATRLERYHEWRVSNERAPDLTELEAARPDWRLGPHLRVIFLDDEGESASAREATIASLERQTYSNWSLAFAGAAMGQRGAREVIGVARDAEAGALWAGLEASDILVPVHAGDTMADYAMAALVEFASTRPEQALFYADEDSSDLGRYVEPELKPDWSPIFQRARPYVGRAIYARRRAVEGHAQRPMRDMLHPRTWEALFTAAPGPVGHIRRVLLTKKWRPSRTRGPVAVARPAAPRATATIILPTRDRADLLAACLTSLERTSPRDFDLVIVDNGSKEAAARRLLEQVTTQSGVQVLSADGAFNFSALCNRAAERAAGRVLVFLNNDTEALRPDWLVNLVGWAVQPEVGAVGASLFYPSGRVQHAGLVLGLGGYAAHIDIGASPTYAGYLDRFTAPREVSAVTGACLAVEKSKFDGVGGFDEQRFPVELGDVDLCLRLAARGWKTVLTPDAVLRHKESATRGSADVARRYAAERRHFLESWGEVIVDDPFFHPALSLTARRTSLDH
jgi:GT2 family glycosyltransferase